MIGVRCPRRKSSSQVLLAISVLFTIAFAARVDASDPGFYLSVGGGWASLLKGQNPPEGFRVSVKLGDLFNRRQSVAASVGYVATRHFALRGQVERSRFAFNTKQDTFVWSHPSFHGSIASGEPATILSTDLSVKMMIPLKTNRFTPFFIAGGGFATVSYDVTAEQFNSVPRSVDPTGTVKSTRRITSSRTVGCYALGLGADVELNHRFGLSAEWRYHRPLTSNLEIEGQTPFDSTSYHSTIVGLTLRLSR